MAIILYIVTFIIYILLGLAPYYVAYLLIEPHSFLGIIGVFLLGSVIVPLTIMLAGISIAAIGGVIGISTTSIRNQSNTDINYGYDSNVITVNEVIPKKKNKKMIFIFCVIGLVAILGLIAIWERQKSSYGTPNFNNESAEEVDTKALYEQPASVEDTDLSELTESQDNSSGLFNAIATDGYIKDDYQLMNYAVNTVLNIVDKSGISGAAKYIRDCYIDPNMSNLYCVYLDNSARLLDTAVTSSHPISRNEYLSDERSRQRQDKFLYIPAKINDADSHAQKIQRELWSILGQAVRSRYPDNEANGSNLSTQPIEPKKNFENEMNEQFKPSNKDMSLKENTQTDQINSPESSSEMLTEMTAEEAKQILSE